ncbi:integrase family protein [Leisingera sp. McT4-56]|nr:integrase family protein [Leisingera sp. McT4-56]
MPRLLLNASVIDALPNPETGQRIYYDSKLPGFGVRITKSAKSYIAEARVSGRKRRVTIASVGVLPVTEARKRAQQELGRMASDIDPNAAKAEARARSMTLNAALEEHLKSRNLKPATTSEYRARLHSNFPDWLDKELKAITPAAVVKRFDKLTKERSPQVANGAFRVFRAVYRFARAYSATDAGTYVLPECPCQRLQDLGKWHKPVCRKNHLTNDQLPGFFSALEKSHNPRFRDFAELIVRTGLRRNEAATLLWSDVNLNAKTITVRAEMAKNGCALTLPLSWQAHEILQRRRNAAPRAEAVFAASTRFDPRKSVARLREASSCNFTLHDLRRTFAIQAERVGTPYSMLKRMLNHSSAGDVTLSHYLTCTDPETLRPYTQMISDELDRLAKQD